MPTNKLTDEHDELMRGYLVNGLKAGAVAGVGATAAVYGLQRYSIFYSYSTYLQAYIFV